MYVCITLQFNLLLYDNQKINKRKFLPSHLNNYLHFGLHVIHMSTCVNARLRYNRSQHTKNQKSWSLIVLQSKQEDYVIGGGN